VKKRNKNNVSSFQHPNNKDIYNVKENLKKLRSGTGKEGYETESDIFNGKSSNEYYGSNHQDDFSKYSTTTTADRFEKINDKFSSDISGIKDVIFQHKETVTEKFNLKLDKTEFRYWIGGIIGAAVILATFFYTLSYQVTVSDVKEIKVNMNEVNRRQDKFEIKQDLIDENLNSSTYSKKQKDSLKNK
jgi:hypothetical protein